MVSCQGGGYAEGVDSSFQRARQPEQKEERRAHLLSTAREMLDESGDVQGLGLNELARRAGMAKSNVYRYFETREALLMELLWDEWAAWYADMTATVRKPAKGGDALISLVRHLARTLAARPRLCALTAALPSVLEQNLSEEAIRDFKLRSLDFLREGATFLASRVPVLSVDAWARLVHDSMAVIAGLHPFAHPAASAARALSDPALRFYRRDFAVDLERFLLALAEAERAASPQRIVSGSGTRSK